MVFLEEAPGLYRPLPVTSYTLPGGQVVVDGLDKGQRIVVAGAYAVRSAMENAPEPEEEA